MEKKNDNSALHFFLYLLHFFSLAFVAFGAGAIIFQYINKFFPQSLLNAFQGAFDQGGIKFGIAALFVAGPIFFFSARFINTYLLEGKIPEDSRVRRWLTYVVLFFAAGTIVGDLIALIINFLEGDIALRFMLKVLTILLIAGCIFEYYFWDMRRSGVVGKKYKQDRFVFVATVAFVVIIFLTGFFIIDSPTVSRQKKIDQQTVNNLQNVDSSVRSYFDRTKQLPGNLQQLEKTDYFPVFVGDNAVEYRKISDRNFELCADFIHSDLEDESANSVVFESFSKEWSHKQGKVCFERIVLEQTEVKPIPVR